MTNCWLCLLVLCCFQDPETQRQVQQARLAVHQEATRARLGKMLNVVDPDSLAECHRLATSAQLGQEVLGQVQQLQAGAESLQAAVAAVQQYQRQQLDEDEAVPGDLQAEFAASLRKVEALCKPGKREAGYERCIAAPLVAPVQCQHRAPIDLCWLQHGCWSAASEVCCLDVAQTDGPH